MQQPNLNAQDVQRIQQMTQLIAREMEQSGGAIPFDRYMELALYAPGLGYYVGSVEKIGTAGDFITAPEISPLFARCLAHQCAEVLSETGGSEILEFGAGTGLMAADILAEMEKLGALPVRYNILELSPDLQRRQRETLQAKVPQLADRVCWLNDLPSGDFVGIVLGNEVLDAMPVSRFRRTEQGVEEQFVELVDGELLPVWRLTGNQQLADAVARIEQNLGPLAPGYESEINLRLAPWISLLGQRLLQGAVILIDYGYSRQEYYHAERSMGTLICHSRHRAHADPFVLPGLQDITASVDFSAVAAAALTAGFTLAGYTTQANFLLGCGLDKLLADSDPQQVSDHLSLVQGVKQLTLPSAMGERFKVIGLTRGAGCALMGFGVRDLSSRL